MRIIVINWNLIYNSFNKPYHRQKPNVRWLQLLKFEYQKRPISSLKLRDDTRRDFLHNLFEHISARAASLYGPTDPTT